MADRPERDLLQRLVAAPGIYRGDGDGPESGPFVARLEIRPAVQGRVVLIDYEAFGEDGLSQLDHAMLAEDEAARLDLHVSSLELPGVVRFVETGPGEFVAYEGPVLARIVIGTPGEGRLTYAWWWARGDSAPKEQSRADLTLTH